MKTKLHKLISMAVLGVTLQMQSLPAWAGLAGNTEVTIILDQSGYRPLGAYGTLTGARYSADYQQFIACYDHHKNFIGCHAKDKIGRYVYCDSSDPKLIAAFNGMTDSSYINFRLTPGTTQCSQITVSNGSSNLR